MAYPNFRTYARWVRRHGFDASLPAWLAKHLDPDHGLDYDPSEVLLVIDPRPEVDPYDQIIDNIEQAFDMTQAERVLARDPRTVAETGMTGHFDIDDGEYRSMLWIPGIRIAVDRPYVTPHRKAVTVSELETRTRADVLDLAVFPEDL